MTTVHRSLKVVAAVTTLAIVAACGTVMPAQRSGFLSHYDSLQYEADGGPGVLRASLAIDPASSRVAEVVWRVPGTSALTPQEQRAMQASLQAALQNELAKLPAVPGGRAVTVRAAITRIETVSAGLNVVLSALLLGPLDRGGAAVEIEAVDTDNQRQLAALTVGHFAPLSDFGARFSKLAPAEISLRKAAADFMPLLGGPTPAAGPVASR